MVGNISPRFSPGPGQKNASTAVQLPPMAQMAICVGGIYCSFIVWALCQERLSTTPYESTEFEQTDKFRSVLFLNTIQSLFSAIAAVVFLYITKSQPGRPRPNWKSVVGLPSSIPSSGSASPKELSHSGGSPKKLLQSYAFIALVASMASPFGFLSLSHISFPTLLLGKSCKLVPVMLMNVVLYQRKYPMHKYALVGMVTVGIWAFMAFKDTSGKTLKGPQTSSLLGMGLLTINLLLDGVVNSTQDEVFSRYTIEGPQMMFFMNVFSTLITLFALLVPTALTPSFLLPTATSTSIISDVFKSSPETPFNALSSALSFISTHEGVTKDIFLFSLTGAIGQLFIFLTLSLYGSLTLVTITVTRKMVTMLLSVFVFDHSLTKGQWGGVAVVFMAILMEAEVKRRETIAKKRIKRGRD